MPTVAYERKKALAIARQRRVTAEGQEIGDIPPVKDSARKTRAMRDFRYFCEAYFPKVFTLAWSEDHLDVIRKIEYVASKWGAYAVALPRGHGKTKLCESACMWALLNGQHRFVIFIGQSEKAADRSMRALKSQLRHNAALLEDFPEVIYPIRRIRGEARQCTGQTHHGEPTLIGWKADEIILPTIPGSRASGAIVKTVGIEGGMRGEGHTLSTGEAIRPDFAVVDDPQTRQSARSCVQCNWREQTIKGDILGMEGPCERMGAIIPCTVIYEDDLADRLTDRDKNPQLRGTRVPLIKKWSDGESLWREYQDVRRNAQRTHDDDPDKVEEVCNAFYTGHRAKMDAGAVESWPERVRAKNEAALSLLQYAWNIRTDRGDAAFFAEYQNEPLPEFAFGDDQLSPDEIAARTNNHARGIAMNGTVCATAFIDLQESSLWWVVCGWEPNFTGSVLDYGIEPDQKTDYIVLRDIRRTLAKAAPGAGLEGSWYAGLERLVNRLMTRDWKRDDGTPLHLSTILIDCNYAKSTETVYRFCRASDHRAILLPSRGTGVTAAGRPMREWQRRHGERHGDNWVVGAEVKRKDRRIIYDANYWKSFVTTRLKTPIGDPGALTLFGRQALRTHRMIADHFCAEYGQNLKNETTGRTVRQFTKRDKNRDEHLWDGLVGCAVAASTLGVSLPGMEIASVKRRRVSFAEMQRRAKGM